jgi:hypothetical protein
MSISYISRSFATTTTLTVPASTANGDLMLAFIHSNASITGPAGWTAVRNNVADSHSAGFVWIGYRIAASEPASYAITSAGNVGYTCHTYRQTAGWNATPVQTVTYADDTSSDTSYVAPSITAGQAGTAVAFVCCSFAITAGVSSVDNSFTLRHTANAAPDSTGTNIGSADKAVIAGATGATTFTSSSNVSAGYQMLIAEVAATQTHQMIV